MTTSSLQGGFPQAPASDSEQLAVQVAENPRGVLVQHLPIINALVRRMARRHHLSPQDADDLASNVLLHLVQHDYHVLRQFRGRSSLRTYLFVVIARQCLDYRDHDWGKWRASAVARRMGPIAVQLERAIWRDRMSVEAACARLADDGIRLTHDEACAILDQIPSRLPRMSVGEDHLEGVPAIGGAPEFEIRQSAQIVSRMLQSALTSLNAAERRLLKLRFRDCISVADLARRYGVDQKALYRRFNSLLARLRAELEHQGVRAHRMS